LDLAFRAALNDHVAAFVAPLESQATTLIAKVREQADGAKIDLRKVFALLESERGNGGDALDHNRDFYAGLL